MKMGEYSDREREGSSCSSDDTEARDTAPTPPTTSSSLASSTEDGSREPRDAESDGSKPARVRWRDLPNKDQLFVLSLCRLCEPLSNVCLLPYIFYLVRSVLPPPAATDPPDDRAARISAYSGVLVAAFPLAQCAVSLPWGRLSDRRGRRRSIVGGLLVSVLANAGFGFSRSLPALLAWRVLAGLANGNVGIMRTATAEVVRERRYQTKAFLLLPLVFNSGMVASLALGGCLADPVVNLAWLFGPEGLLNAGGNPEGVSWALEYPYALPALLNAAILGVSLILAALGLRETLPGKEGYDDFGLRAGAALARWASRFSARLWRRHGYAAVEVEEERLVEGVQVDREKPEPPIAKTRRPTNTSFQGIWTRRVTCALVSFGLLPLHNSAFMHVFPVYLSSPPADNSGSTFLAFSGGLGLRSSTIGLWLSAFGVGGILLQLFIYPRLQARIGTRGVFRIALFLFPATYAAAPYLSLLHDGAGRWVYLGLVVCAQIMARTMAIPSTVILLTESAPSRTVLGTIHGAGNTLASLARAVGPAVGGYVFGLGVKEGVVGLVWWLYLVGIALCALAWSYVTEGDSL